MNVVIFIKYKWYNNINFKMSDILIFYDNTKLLYVGNVYWETKGSLILISYYTIKVEKEKRKTIIMLFIFVWNCKILRRNTNWLNRE